MSEPVLVSDKTEREPEEVDFVYGINENGDLDGKVRLDKIMASTTSTINGRRAAINNLLGKTLLPLRLS